MRSNKEIKSGKNLIKNLVCSHLVSLVGRAMIPAELEGAGSYPSQTNSQIPDTKN